MGRLDLQDKLIYKKLLNNDNSITEKESLDFIEKCTGYYYTGDSLISDAEYDVFKKFHEITFQTTLQIGTKETLKGFAKAAHGIPMGSLTEFDTSVDVIKDIQKWYDKNCQDEDICSSEKLDGLSVSIKFDKGILNQGLTRGDGFEGDDITANVLKMARVPNKLPIPFSGYLRGEIALLKSVKQKYFPKMANERNGAVGITKRKNGEGCEHLDIFFYKLYPDKDQNLNFKTETELLDYIKNDLGLLTPRYYTTSLKTLLALHERYEEDVREKLDYIIDGLVVNVNSIERQIEITDNELLPEYARKFKFEAEKAETELLQVITQVGRTGAITPLAILDPVVCGGTLISKATLHNFDEIERLGIEAGDVIQVIRSKDVIPKITGVVRKNEYSSPIKRPKVCPVCASPLEKDDTTYFCRNDYCGARVAKALLHWLNVLGLKNMGEKLIEALIDSGKLKAIPDFYKLKLEDISELDRQGVKNATKILKEINSKTTITVSELLAGLNIKSLSVKRAEILEDNFGDLDHILKLKTRDIVNLEGFEAKLATFIVSGLMAKAPLIKEILKYINIKKKVEGALTGKSFCFSGFRDPDLETKLKAKGGRIASGVSKKLDYLIVRNKNGTTSKIKKAKSYGISVLDPDDLHGVLNNTLF